MTAGWWFGAPAGFCGGVFLVGTPLIIDSMRRHRWTR